MLKLQGTPLALHVAVPDVKHWTTRLPDMVHVYRYGLSLSMQITLPYSSLPTRALHFLWRKDAIRLLGLGVQNYQRLSQLTKTRPDLSKVINGKFRKKQTRPDGVLIQQILKPIGDPTAREKADCYVLYYCDGLQSGADYISINGIIPLLLSSEEKGIGLASFFEI